MKDKYNFINIKIKIKYIYMSKKNTIIKSHKGLSLVALHINHNYSDDSNAWKSHCIDFCNKRDIKILK